MNFDLTTVKAVIRVTSVARIVELLRRPGLDFGCAPVAREHPPGVYNLTLFNPSEAQMAALRAEGFEVVVFQQPDNANG